MAIQPVSPPVLAHLTPQSSSAKPPLASQRGGARIKGPSPTLPAEGPAPTVNLTGQTLGTIIDTVS
ncbi:MAG: hypothetical protein KGQ58_07595 [Proteobacteria bacterium]|nr:hypothetical protein [Pseudomonadota bacterium]